MNTKKDLIKHIYVEPATVQARPYLIEYISLLVAEAQQLTQNQLLHGDGHSIAMDLCGALANHWKGANGEYKDGWFNDKNEPALDAILDIVTPLDADPNDQEGWNKLFALASKLR